MKIFVGILFWIFIQLFKVMKNIQALFLSCKSAGYFICGLFEKRGSLPFD